MWLIFFIFNSRILNKLTPEKFDKLSLELLNVGIESHVILKGIILLVSFYVYFGNAEQLCKSGHYFWKFIDYRNIFWIECAKLLIYRYM